METIRQVHEKKEKKKEIEIKIKILQRSKLRPKTIARSLRKAKSTFRCRMSFAWITRRRKRGESKRGGGKADRQLITVGKLQSRLMAKLITDGAAFRARSHASVQPADWRDAVSCPLLPARSVPRDNMLAFEFPGLKIEKLTVAGWT